MIGKKSRIKNTNKPWGLGKVFMFSLGSVTGLVLANAGLDVSFCFRLLLFAACDVLNFSQVSVQIFF